MLCDAGQTDTATPRELALAPYTCGVKKGAAYRCNACARWR